MLELKCNNKNNYLLLYKWADWLAINFIVPEVLHISCNTGTCALPDMSALALGCCAPSGIVRRYQAMHSCLCYNYYIWYSFLSDLSPSDRNFFMISTFIRFVEHQTFGWVFFIIHNHVGTSVMSYQLADKIQVFGKLFQPWLVDVTQGCLNQFLVCFS